MAVYFSGYVFQDDGDAVNGATVELLQVSDGAQEATTTTNSSGFWSFDETDEDRYDIKITSGTSIRYRKWADEISVKMLDVRNNEGNGVPAAVFANHTNNADNDIVYYRSLRGTGADNDEMFFRYYMDDASSNTTEVARMTVKLISASAASEDSEIRWGVAVGGSIVDVFTISNTSGGATDMTMDVAGDINLDADGGDILFKDGGTTFGSATNTSGNLIIKSGTTTALTFSGANVTIAGDLTISGDDLTMGTNTNTAILVADGTNYNPVVPSGDVGLTNGGVFSIASGVIVDADVNASAAITVSKLALTAGDGLTLNTNDMDLDAALTTVTSIYNASLKMGRDSQNLIDFATTDNKIILRVNNVDEVELVENALSPITSDGVALGTGSLMWSDLFVASGAVVNFNNGDVTLTHSSNTLTVAGGTLATAALTATTFAPSDDVTIADGKGIIIESEPADDAYTGIYGNFANATGSTITKGQVVYMTGTANQVAPARANAVGTMPAVAMAIADVANGATGNFLMYGFAHDASAFISLTIGGEAYVSDTAAGALDATAPADDGEFVQIIGVGMHGDKLFFNPQLPMVEIA